MKSAHYLILGILVLCGMLTAHAEDSLEITLVGQVKRPSRISVDGDDSFFQILKQNGGATAWGNPRRLLLIRVSDSATEDIPKTTTTTKEIRLMPGKNPSLKELGIASGDIIYVCTIRIM
jgi:hypothetical protein